MAQDQAGFNWQQYAADNPDVLSSGYGIGTYTNAADQMWGHYQEANRLGDHRAYTGYAPSSSAPAPGGGWIAADGPGGYQAPDMIRADEMRYSTGNGASGDNGGYNSWSWGGANGMHASDVDKNFGLYGLDRDNSTLGDRFGLQIKTGEKQGSAFDYVKGSDGNYYRQGQDPTKRWWNTNPELMDSLGPLSVLAAPFAVAAMGAGVAGAGAMAADGTFGAAAGAGLGAGAGTAATTGAVESLWPGATSSLATGGTGATGGYMGALEGGSLFGQGGLAAGGSSSMFDNIKQAYDYYSQGKKVLNGVNSISDMASGGGRGGQRPGGGAGMAQDQGGMGFLQQLLGIGGGLYSEHQNRDAFKSLNDMYSRREQERQPYVERLNTSYADPNSFLNGPEGQAISNVAANKFGRQAARAGVNANDVDRTRLLQDHMMGALEKHREGLRGDLQRFDLTAPQQAFMEGVKRDANAGGATMGGLGYANGGAGNLQSLLTGAQGAYGSMADWFRGPGQTNGSIPGDLYGPPASAADTSSWGSTINNPSYGGVFEGDFPVSDWFDFDNFDLGF